MTTREETTPDFARRGRGARAAAFLGAACWAMLLAGCGAPDSFEDYDESLYQAMRYGTDEAFAAHVELLHAILERAEESGAKPPPGMAAEYGFDRARLGFPEEGMIWLDKEVQYYPESQTMVQALKRILAGDETLFTDTAKPEGEKEAAP